MLSIIILRRRKACLFVVSNLWIYRLDFKRNAEKMILSVSAPMHSVFDNKMLKNYNFHDVHLET